VHHIPLQLEFLPQNGLERFIGLCLHKEQLGTHDVVDVCLTQYLGIADLCLRLEVGDGLFELLVVLQQLLNGLIHGPVVPGKDACANSQEQGNGPGTDFN